MSDDDPRPTGVLLTAVGGPASLDEVGPFLLDMRGGRPTPQSLVDEFRERYRRIGGRSPLLDISRAQAKALETRLSAEGGAYRCYVGMRNWHPYIRETIRGMREEDLGRIVVLALTPYRSRRSVGMYFQAVREALSELGRPIPVAYVESWNTEPALVDAYASAVEDGIRRLRRKGFLDPVVLFTAHSLPKKLIDEGDPYERELEETMDLIRKRLPPMRARLAWQSAGRTDEPWLGPPMEEALEELGRGGERAVLIAPFGFVSDHLEILYDVDIEAKARAEALGIHLERTESMNTDPRFIAAMASAVRSAGIDAWRPPSDNTGRSP